MRSPLPQDLRWTLFQLPTLSRRRRHAGRALVAARVARGDERHAVFGWSTALTFVTTCWSPSLLLLFDADPRRRLDFSSLRSG
jgi:hypothetical protein